MVTGSFCGACASASALPGGEKAVVKEVGER